MNYNPQSLHTWKRRRYFFFLFIPLIMLAIGAVVMYLWNAIIPAVLGLGVITFWQAIGILLLSKILFGGFRGAHGHHNFHSHGREMREKWMNLTPEEREKMKAEWRGRCGQPPLKPE